MAKTKVRYCTRCGRQTVHKLVGHESIAEGTGFVRAIVAVASLGISEIVAATWYYECQKCGKITED